MMKSKFAHLKLGQENVLTKSVQRMVKGGMGQGSISVECPGGSKVVCQSYGRDATCAAAGNGCRCTENGTGTQIDFAVCPKTLAPALHP